MNNHGTDFVALLLEKLQLDAQKIIKETDLHAQKTQQELLKYQEQVAQFWGDLKKEHERQLKEEENHIKNMFKDSDIICLDVAGVKTRCSRSTLTQFPNSLLASMFSGRWENSLVKNKKGDIFLDVNPECFMLILDWLRSKKIGASPSLPTVKKEQECHYEALIHYLGLQDVISQIIPASFQFVDFFSMGTNVKLTNNDRTVTDMQPMSKPYWTGVSTKEQFTQGTYNIKLSVKGRFWMHISNSWNLVYDKEKNPCLLNGHNCFNSSTTSERQLTMDVNCITKKATMTENNTTTEVGMTGDRPWTLYIGLYCQTAITFISSSHSIHMTMQQTSTSPSSSSTISFVPGTFSLSSSPPVSPSVSSFGPLWQK